MMITAWENNSLIKRVLGLKREEHHDEIKKKGYAELGDRNEENIRIASLIHIIT